MACGPEEMKRSGPITPPRLAARSARPPQPSTLDPIFVPGSAVGSGAAGGKNTSDKYH